MLAKRDFHLQTGNLGYKTGLSFTNGESWVTNGILGLLFTLYFESNKRKVFIVTEKDTFVAYGKLNDIEESLKQSKVPFLRVHQSYLVNYKHVEGQAYDFVVMDNGKRISISEDRRKLIGEQYCSMEDTFYVNE